MATLALNLDAAAARIIGALAQTQQALALIPSYVADTLLSVSDVESVYVKGQADNTFRVWTVVNHPPEDAYDAIYDLEKSIIGQFSPISFDFQVISRNNKDLRSLITLSCQGWRKEER